MGIALKDIEMEISGVLEVIDESGETELTEEQKADIESYLAELGQQEADKIDGFVGYCRMLEKQAKALKEEAAYLEARAKTRENTLKFLKQSYQGVMEQNGLKKLSGQLYSVSMRESKSCRVEDESLIPEEYWTVKTTRTLSKADALAAMKRGESVPGCAIGITHSLMLR